MRFQILLRQLTAANEVHSPVEYLISLPQLLTEPLP